MRIRREQHEAIKIVQAAVRLSVRKALDAGCDSSWILIAVSKGIDEASIETHFFEEYIGGNRAKKAG
jgi:hypothetical protein